MKNINKKNKILTPKELKRIKSLKIITNIIVYGIFSGLHKSILKGFSTDFAHHREYLPGDELRTIDWKVYGRSDSLVVKEYKDQSNMQSFILLDISESMNYTSHEVSKLFYSKMIAAAMIHLLISQRDKVGLITFSDKIKNYIKPENTMKQKSQLLSKIEKLKANGNTSIENVLKFFGNNIKRKSYIILISDLFDTSFEFLKLVKGLKYKGNKILIFWIRDPYEVNFKYSINLTLVEPESKKKFSYNSSEIKRSYSKIMSDFKKRLKKELMIQNIDIIDAITTIPVSKLLLEIFLKKSNKLLFK